MKKEKEIVNKTVSFNIVDPDQKLMLEHVMTRPNFSGYIKRLIQRDMEGAAGARNVVSTYEASEDDDAVEFDPSSMF